MIGINKEASKPKVLIFLNRLVIGGPAIDVISMAGFLQSDFEILIIYGEKESHEVEANYLLKKYPSINTKKIHTLKKTFNPFLILANCIAIFNLIRKYKPQIVHTHGALPGAIGRVAAYINKVPVIVHTFHGHFFHSYYNRFFSAIIIFIERQLSAISNAVIATSSRQKIDLVDTYKVVPQNKIATIGLGIDEAFLENKSLGVDIPFSSRYPIDEQTIAIGIIARIVKVKNFNLFVDVVELVQKKTTKKLVFFVIGDGYLKKDIQKQLTNKSISWSDAENETKNTSVIFTSWISNIGDAIASLDIVILTSNNEGTGLSLAESQYCGKPVVATNVGGVPDTVIDGKTGFLVPSNNVNDFTEKLLLLIEDDKKRTEMGIAAKEFAMNTFAKKREVNDLASLYYSLLNTNSKSF